MRSIVSIRLTSIISFYGCFRYELRRDCGRNCYELGFGSTEIIYD